METSKFCSLKSFTSSSDAATRVNIIVTNGILMESRSFDLEIWEKEPSDCNMIYYIIK